MAPQFNCVMKGLRKVVPPSRIILAQALALFVTLACGGAGDGGTGPERVSSVAITAPAAPPTFQTLTRTLQFAAVARDAAAAPVQADITWLSSNPGVASVTAAGLVTATGNGSADITASAAGIASSAMRVTVAQMAVGITGAPSGIAFGAIGSSRLLSVSAVDSAGAVVSGVSTVTWTRAGPGTTASVLASGQVTALGLGAADTAVGTAGLAVARVPISVNQVPFGVSISPIAPDTLRTTGRTRQYTAMAVDSNANEIVGADIQWSSSAPAVATVGAGSGLATAVADGSTNIRAAASAASAQRQLVVRRYASNFSITPSFATISTPLGRQVFTGTATDSASVPLPVSWTVRDTMVLGTTGASGTQVTAIATGNGSSSVVMSGGARVDSALVTVSGLPSVNWAVTSGLQGGAVWSLATLGADVFAGTADGGVFRSSNEGVSWTAVNSGLTNRSVGLLAVLGTDLLAGTFDGLFRSTNGGASWTSASAGLTNRSLRALAVSGTTLFVGTTNGVFRSTDGGASWSAVNGGLTNLYVLALSASDSSLVVATEGGVFRSTNGGTLWTAANTGLPAGFVFAFAASGPYRFAGHGNQGVYRSTDDGRTWTAVNAGLKNTRINSMAVAGANLVVGTAYGLFLSTDNGNAWTAVNAGWTPLYGEEVLALTFSGTALFAGTIGTYGAVSILEHGRVFRGVIQ